MNAGRPPPRTRFHPERLLPYACIAAALALLASEFTTTFHLVPPGGDARCAVEASDRHHLAQGVIALFAIGAVLVAVMGASRPAAIAVAIAGVAALALFLVVDLPDANSVGTLSNECASIPIQLEEAKAEPQTGFWLEMAAAVALTFSGAILATLTPNQLASVRPRWLGGAKSRG